MLCVVLYSGIALGAAGTSTSFASMTFHFTPKAVAPATVIRSTLCEGGSEGGMIGGGDGIGCANEPKAKIMERPSIAQAASMAGYFRRISLLPWMIKQAGTGRSLTLITGIADCCVGRDRPCRRTAEQRDELAAVHSITSSASC